MASDEHVTAVRAFNRFYTGVVGALAAETMYTPYSLTEARVLWELAHATSEGRQSEAVELRRLLGLDAGYLSRIMSRFESEGLATRERSAADGRRQVVTLTDAGRSVFAELDKRSDEQVRGMLAGLTDEDAGRLVSAMTVVRRSLTEGDRAGAALVIRPPRTGDLGWVVFRHGALYAAEYGWGPRFEALVARIVADYADGHQPAREAAWIAEIDGERAGCVFCVRKDDETAQLRLLLVEPSARGHGVGGRLVAECLNFAREAGYKRITLWTRHVLTDARRIYERAGFTLDGEEPDEEEGRPLVNQVWSMDLA
ncbi:helix-turn-helix domain-containing GNAT family N-acetyltransferase [Spongiactinospora sp. TRM90649]|uniref:bifunctional helix-turn-helix transcriptional regulator/GNAT family N-acetyltransferase n=1 Tax=Spongiactinospora sp. TRM90649 TaxID=3031114 RepID=UPI0023F96039|nr:helix-turn-helix domain-containing GNAT family N-acetyltransferase [Spongiactinospora sp. TRM90649]MDF5756752.1 helix-turn-helix domain-containing GNAT family N-acetyltransferase [Spongiactinospora sp. TRM90649]